jgi:hypothetical protein
MLSRTDWTKLIVLVAVAFGIANEAAAEEEEQRKLGWSLKAEFSSVFTGGNAQASTFGVAAIARRVWERAEGRFEGGSVLQESGITTRQAVGSVDDFTVREDTRSERTAEAYYSRGRYDYKVSKRFFAVGGIDWLRNRFAGINSRFLIAAGAGNTWADRDAVRFKTSYALTYTFQSDVVENPFVSQTFPGLRLGYDYFYKLTSSTDFESELIADWNLDNTEDVRVDWTNGLPVSISSKLALKPNFRLIWRNDPALTDVALVGPGGEPTGETVSVPLKELDTFLTIALVVSL